MTPESCEVYLAEPLRREDRGQLHRWSTSNSGSDDSEQQLLLEAKQNNTTTHNTRTTCVSVEQHPPLLSVSTVSPLVLSAQAN